MGSVTTIGPPAAPSPTVEQGDPGKWHVVVRHIHSGDIAVWLHPSGEWRWGSGCRRSCVFSSRDDAEEALALWYLKEAADVDSR